MDNEDSLATKLNETTLNVYLITFEVTISSVFCFTRILIRRYLF